jgi:hypothetical protein
LPPDELSKISFPPPAKMSRSADEERIEPPAIVNPFCARKLFACIPPSVVEVAVLFSTNHGVSNTVEVAAPAVVRKMPPARVSPPVVMRRSVACSPPLNVEVAVARERIAPLDAVMVSPLEVERPFVRTPPANVEVALVPVPCASIVPPNTDEVAPPVPVTNRLPAMPSVADGVLDPMPTLPLESTRKAVLVAVAVDVEIRKSGVVARERASSERSADGVVVPPSPVYPACDTRKVVEVA